MRVFTLTITDEDGVVLDSTEVSEDELKHAQTYAVAARAILAELRVGAE